MLLQFDYSVQMVRHHCKFIKSSGWKALWNAHPTIMDDDANLCQFDLKIGNLTENAQTIMRADGDKVKSGLTIVVSRYLSLLSAWRCYKSHAVSSGMRPLESFYV